MQKTVVFSWKRGVPIKRQDTFLEKIHGWKGVSVAGHLEPHATDPDDLRICFVQIDSSMNEDDVVKQLRKNRDVEAASIQPERYAAAV